MTNTPPEDMSLPRRKVFDVMPPPKRAGARPRPAGSAGGKLPVRPSGGKVFDVRPPSAGTRRRPVVVRPSSLPSPATPERRVTAVAPARAVIPAKKEKRALPVVITAIFLDVLGVGILIPVLPQLVYRIFTPAGYSFKASLVMLGWLTAVYPLMQFFSTPILGQLSDRYGRKPLLGLSLLGTALGYIIFAIAILTKNIPLLFVGRALDGLTGGNISVARAVIADVSPPRHIARNFGLMGACFGVGFVMGPYLGARLAVPHASMFGLFQTPGWFNAATPFWFTAGLSTATMLLVWTILPETLGQARHRARVAWHQALTNIRRAALRPGLRVIFAAEFLFWSGFTFYTTFFQILLMQKLHFNIGNVGDLFAYIGIWIAIAQMVVVPLALKRFSSPTILRCSLIGSAVALLAQVWPENTAQLLLVAPFMAVFNGLVMANAPALVSMSAKPEEQGEVLGIDASVQALAQSLPAIISGYVAVQGAAMPLVVGSAIIFAGGLVYNLLYRARRNIGQ